MDLPHVPLSHIHNFALWPQLVASLPDTDGCIGAPELELVSCAVCSFLDECLTCVRDTALKIANSPAAITLLHILAMESAAQYDAPISLTQRQLLLDKLLHLDAVRRYQAVRSAITMVAIAVQSAGAVSE